MKMNDPSLLKLEPIEIDNNQVILSTAPMSHFSPTKRSRKSAHPSKTVKLSTSASSLHLSTATSSSDSQNEHSTRDTLTAMSTDDELSNIPPSDHIEEQENQDDETTEADEEINANYPHASSKRPRLTHDKRLEANARERERVHNLTAAFEALRQVIPMYGDQPKLSRLSILRIACSYVLVLGALNEIDFSEGQNAYTFNESFHLLSSTILSELKRKKTISNHRHD